MKCLDLFSGTGSVAKVLREKNHEVITLDIDGKSDINVDILEWDYTKYPVGHFDYIHASCPCDTFSTLNYSNLGRRLKCINMEVFTREILEDRIQKIGLPVLYKTLEIINYFNPKFYTIENPAYSQMRKYIDLPNTIVDYCKYGFPYKKPTRIWNNFNFKGKTCCMDCEFIVDVSNVKCHLQQCGNNRLRKLTRHEYGIGRFGEGKIVKGGGNSRTERHRIPPELVESWLSYMLI